MEKTILGCYHDSCNYAEVIATPDDSGKLSELIERLKHCPICGRASVVQSAWRTTDATFGSVQY